MFTEEATSTSAGFHAGPLSRSNWNLEMLVGLLEVGKTLGARTRTNNTLELHTTSGLGIEPRPHWWEASALSTAPSALPEV